MRYEVINLDMKYINWWIVMISLTVHVDILSLYSTIRSLCQSIITVRTLTLTVPYNHHQPADKHP
jgi:hypothetical protein